LQLGKVSLERIEEFLHKTELLDAYLEKPSDIATVPSPESNKDIGFRNATFSWSIEDENDGTLTPSRRQFKLRIKGELLFKRNGINLIIGPT